MNLFFLFYLYSSCLCVFVVKYLVPVALDFICKRLNRLPLPIPWNINIARKISMQAIYSDSFFRQVGNADFWLLVSE